MSSINGNWLTFAKTYNLAEYGLDALYPQQDGAAGRWRLTLEREGKSIEAMLEIKKVRGGGYQAEIDGVAVPVTVDGNSITLNLLWRDAFADELRTGALRRSWEGRVLGNPHDRRRNHAVGLERACLFRQLAQGRARKLHRRKTSRHARPADARPRLRRAVQASGQGNERRRRHSRFGARPRDRHDRVQHSQADRCAVHGRTGRGDHQPDEPCQSCQSSFRRTRSLSAI